MGNKNAKSWKGIDALKSAALLQMQAHYEKAVLEDIIIDAVSLDLCGATMQPDYPLCAKMLGLEEAVLRLGFYLFDSFPEDRKSIQAFIRLRMDFLEHIPVGVDLSQVCSEFMVWRLENADFGFIDGASAQAMTALLQDIAAIFYQENSDFIQIQEKVNLALRDLKSTISTQWKKEQKIDMDHYRVLNALETAAAVCTFPVNAATAANTAHAYLFGANGVNVRNADKETEIMGLKLIDLLRAAPEI